MLGHVLVLTINMTVAANAPLCLLFDAGQVQFTKATKINLADFATLGGKKTWMF